MIQKIKSYLLIVTSILTMAAPLAVPIAVSAQGCTSNTADQIAKGATVASGDPVDCSSTDQATSNIGTLAKNIVNVFSVIVGIVAVIMIIYGGFRYITSGGDSGSVGNAKNTLIYAIVGLIIVALAQLIVHFVLSSTNQVTTTGATT